MPKTLKLLPGKHFGVVKHVLVTQASKPMVWLHFQKEKVAKPVFYKGRDRKSTCFTLAPTDPGNPASEAPRDWRTSQNFRRISIFEL